MITMIIMIIIVIIIIIGIAQSIVSFDGINVSFKLTMYVARGLPLFGCLCWESQSNTFEAVSSLWRAQWPTNLIKSSCSNCFIITPALDSSWLFVCSCQCTLGAVCSILV